MKFEYKIICCFEESRACEAVLNRHGEEGWELVSVHEGKMYLKRSKKPKKYRHPSRKSFLT